MESVNKLLILYENENILAVEKERGLPTLPLPSGKSETLASLLATYYPEMTSIGGEFQSGIVHRLDNDTSGIIIAARNQKTYEVLRAMWNTDQVEKGYLAWVVGHAPISGSLNQPIAHHPTNHKKMVVCTSKKEAKKLKARNAETQFKRLKVVDNMSLLQVKIKTGVRHQIRVHLASLGFPLLGDALYGKKRTENIKGHLLHLHRIYFKTWNLEIISKPTFDLFFR